MNFDVIKEACIEYCENIYALAINSLRKNNNSVLAGYVNDLMLIEDDIRLCDNLEVLNAYKMLLEDLVNKIEGIINE